MKVRTNCAVSKLKNHPLSQKIYRDKPDQDLIKSVSENGIIADVIVNSEHWIIAGHRRVQAARILNWEEVPVCIDPQFDDELTAELGIIESNRTRVKSNEQIAREMQELLRIEETRRAIAKTKLAATPYLEQLCNDASHNGGPDSANLAEVHGPKEGEPIDAVAEFFGTTPRTAQRMVASANGIDQAEDSGDRERADQIRDALNQSASAGERAVASSSNNNDDKTPNQRLAKHLGGVDKTITEAVKRLYDLIDEFGHKSELDAIARLLNPAHEALVNAKRKYER